MDVVASLIIDLEALVTAPSGQEKNTAEEEQDLELHHVGASGAPEVGGATSVFFSHGVGTCPPPTQTRNNLGSSFFSSSSRLRPGIRCRTAPLSLSLSLSLTHPHPHQDRNTIKALNWFGSVREKLDDPNYAGWFIRFRDNGTASNYSQPACDTNWHPQKCSGYAAGDVLCVTFACMNPLREATLATALTIASANFGRRVGWLGAT